MESAETTDVLMITQIMTMFLTDDIGDNGAGLDDMFMQIMFLLLYCEFYLENERLNRPRPTTITCDSTSLSIRTSQQAVTVVFVYCVYRIVCAVCRVRCVYCCGCALGCGCV